MYSIKLIGFKRSVKSFVNERIKSITVVNGFATLKVAVLI